MLGHSLILYLVVQETSIGYLLRQLNEPNQKEKAIYYLSKKFTSCEIKHRHWKCMLRPSINLV